MKFYSLPRSDKMAALIKNGDYQKLEDVEIHVGEHDWQSEPDKCGNNIVACQYIVLFLQQLVLG